MISNNASVGLLFENSNKDMTPKNNLHPRIANVMHSGGSLGGSIGGGPGTPGSIAPMLGKRANPGFQ